MGKYIVFSDLHAHFYVFNEQGFVTAQSTKIKDLSERRV